jgi:hypothetical protein
MGADLVPSIARLQHARPGGKELGWFRIPSPDDAFAPCTDKACDRAATGIGGLPADAAEASWFRWVLGHHVSVGVWRLMGDSLVRGTDEVPGEFHDAYSAMILYAGNCDLATYHAVLRPRMREVHPAFSGVWARDYEHMTMLSSLGAADPAGRILSNPSRTAKKFNRQVHTAVAKRLVPSDRSLLRQAGHEPGQTTDVERDLFDRCFQIERASTCSCVFSAQMRVRIEFILEDVARVPVRIDYRWDEVSRFQDRMPDVLARLLRHV